MSIIYVITILLLFISFFKIKKSNNRLNGLVWIFYSVGLYLCLNIFVTFINSLIRLNNNFETLSIINIIITIIVYVFCIRNKGCQKYYFSKKDILISGIISLLLFVICYIRYDGFTRIAYSISDASVHYYVSNDFAKTGIIEKGMSAFYVNCGLFIRINYYITPYISYNIFNTFMLILMANTFFITCLEFTKKNRYKFIITLTIFYALGYPLNYVLLGFGYLGFGILIINLLILSLYFFLDDNQIYLNKKELLILIVFLLNFCLFFSYYLFVPIVFLIIGLYYIHKWKKKKISLKELILYGVITLIIPFISGFINFILPQFLNGGGNIFTNVGIDGFCFLNIIDILLLLPFVIIIIKRNIKDNNHMLVVFLYIGVILFLALLSILILFKVSSPYYCSKFYYILWLLSFIILLDYKYSKKHNIIFIIVVAFYSLYCGLQVQRIKLNAFLPKVNYDIYFFNYSDYIYKLNNPGIFVDEIELMNKTKDYDEICETKDIFVSTAGVYYNYWMYAFTKYKPNYLDEKYRDFVTVNNFYIFNYDYWKTNDEFKCLIYFKRANIQPDLSNHTVLYENSAGSIIKK